MIRALIAAVLFVVFAGVCTAQEKVASKKPAERKFRLTYGAKILDAPAGAKVRAWIPVPPTSGEQKVTPLSKELPGNGQEGTEERFGNKMLSFEVAAPKSGEVTFKTNYEVVRKEVHGLPPEKMGMQPVKLTDEQRKLLLSADKKVPIGGKPLELLAGKELPAEQLKLARMLYDRVDEHVKYDKSRPGYGNGDVLWVCDSRFGNCTDFTACSSLWPGPREFPPASKSVSQSPRSAAKGRSPATTAGRSSGWRSRAGCRWIFRKRTRIRQ